VGTNFYVTGHRYDGDPQFHVGKRSAAGLYCWDCRVTLCAGGEDQIASGKSPWHETCPRCGKSQTEETLEASSAGRELGFNKSEPEAKTGVRSASAFTWAMDGETFARILVPATECPTCHQSLPAPGTEHPYEPICDEYGRLYTGEQFGAVLAECPIVFHAMVGVEFS
jgi:hypothetical protein